MSAGKVRLGGTLSLTTVYERHRTVIDATEYPLLAQHAAGDSYRTLAGRHGLSHESARQVVLRQATALVNEVEMALYTASKHEALGREAEADWPGLVVPHQPGDGWQLGMSLLQYVVDRLRARDVDVQVRTGPLPDGIVFLLTLGAAS
jgi:hypothetical protein